MLERIVEIVKEQLNVSDVAITADTSFEKDLEVDSLDLFELVMALEEEYDVEIPSSSSLVNSSRIFQEVIFRG